MEDSKVDVIARNKIIAGIIVGLLILFLGYRLFVMVMEKKKQIEEEENKPDPYKTYYSGSPLSEDLYENWSYISLTEDTIVLFTWEFGEAHFSWITHGGNYYGYFGSDTNDLGNKFRIYHDGDAIPTYDCKYLVFKGLKNNYVTLKHKHDRNSKNQKLPSGPFLIPINDSEKTTGDQ